MLGVISIITIFIIIIITIINTAIMVIIINNWPIWRHPRLTANSISRTSAHIYQLNYRSLWDRFPIIGRSAVTYLSMASYRARDTRKKTILSFIYAHRILPTPLPRRSCLLKRETYGMNQLSTTEDCRPRMLQASRWRFVVLPTFVWFLRSVILPGHR